MYIKYKILVLLVMTFGFNLNAIGQKRGQDFNIVLQTYYLKKDNQLIEHSIDFFNNSNLKNKNVKSLIVGFYGGLFLEYPEIKNQFGAHIDKFKNENVKLIFNDLLNENIKIMMSEYPLSPSFNDMNWGAFFSTGKTKYIDQILKNCDMIDNRKDFNFFLTGATAKWSLCSNSKKHRKVKDYLESNKSNIELVHEIVGCNPVLLKDDIQNVIREQRKKGIWNK